MNRRWQRPFYVRAAGNEKDAMGAVTAVYGDAVRHTGNIQPVTDARQLEAYGAIEKRLYSILLNNADGIKKSDGVCFGIPETNPPNFEVVEILPWLRHAKLIMRGLV